MALRNLGQLRQAVEDAGYGTDLATAQNTALNAEYKNLAGKRRWKWLEARTSVTTVAGTSDYTPAVTDLRNYDTLRIADSAGNDYPMDYQSKNWVLDKIHRYNQVSDRGIPRYWTLFAGEFWLYPIPDGAYTVQVDYTRNIVPMVADTDTPTYLPEAYDDILVWGAIARSAVRQNNWLTRDYADGQKQQLINRMEAEYGKEQTQNADEVEWTGMWDSSRWP